MGNANAHNYPLHAAASAGDVAQIQLILRKHPEARDMLNKEGRTALREAVRHSQRAAAEALIEAGADVKELTAAGSTLVHTAANYGAVDMLRFLVQQHKLALNVTNKDGVTPMHAAAGEAQTAAMRALWSLSGEKSLPLNAQTNNGETALHRAARRGSVDAVRELLAWGADPLIRDNNNSLPIDLTLNPEVGQLLKEATKGLAVRHEGGGFAINKLVGALKHDTAQRSPSASSLLAKSESDMSV